MSSFSKLIDDEFDMIKINILNTSKINIFSKAEEIYHKQIIKDLLIKNESTFSEKEQNVVFALDGFIDNIYEIIIRRNQKFNENNIINRAKEIIKNRGKVPRKYR